MRRISFLVSIVFAHFTLSVVILCSALLLTGCGGGGNSQPPSSQPSQQLPQLAGAWEAWAPHSVNGVNTSVSLIDFNLSQDNSTISANQVAIINVVFSGGPGDYTHAIWSPQDCLPGPYSMTGSVSAPNMMSFTLQQTGGEITGTATESLSGPLNGLLSGTYDDPSCSGSNIPFTAGKALSLTGNYTNACDPCGTADPSLVLQVSQDSSYHLTISGSDTADGSFTLSGTAIGSTMWVSGVVAGQKVSYYGWHYAALDVGIQQLFVIDANSNAVVAHLTGPVK
jgi:hypothetical protein